MKLNHQKMLEDIYDLVATDFCLDMEGKTMPFHAPYTQREAERMAKLLGQIYTISHCLTCTACQIKYLVKETK